jgi:hypothetical protein
MSEHWCGSKTLQLMVVRNDSSYSDQGFNDYVLRSRKANTSNRAVEAHWTSILTSVD